MDELQKLYDVLVRDGKYTKSFEEFQGQWGDEAYRNKVYDVVSRDGLYTKDRDSFNQKYDIQSQQGDGIFGMFQQQQQQFEQQQQQDAEQKQREAEQQQLMLEQNKKRDESSAMLDAMKKADGAKAYVKKKAAQEKALQEMGLGQDTGTASASADGSSVSREIMDPSHFDPNILKEKIDISARQDATMAAPNIVRKYNEVKDTRALKKMIAEEEAFNAKQAEDMAAINERESKAKEEEANKFAEENNQLKSLNSFQTLVNTIDSNVIDQEEEDVLSRLDFQFGRFGFTFSESGAGDNITVTTNDGLHSIDIGFDNYTYKEDAAQSERLKEFIREFSRMPKSMQFMKDKKELSPFELEADAFYSKRGLNYFEEKEKWDTYTRLRDEIEFIKEDIDEGKDYEDTKRYPNLYAAGEIRPDIETHLAQLERQRDGLFDSVFDAGFTDEGIIQKTREDFDVHLNKVNEATAKQAADLNLIAQTKEFEIQTAAFEQFGVGAKDLFNVVPKNDEEALTLQSLQEAYYSSQVEKDFAAKKYEIAKTFFDGKVDKEIQGEYVENLESFFTQIESGYASGTAAEQILAVSMGLKDINDPEEKAKAIAIIVDNMRKVDDLSDKQSRVLDRHRSAIGWKEWRSSVAADPFEWASSLFAHSVSEMFPYGSKIVVASTLTGAGIGAGIGSTGLGVGAIPGAITGAGYGFRTGMGASGFAMEYTNAIFDAMRNKGYDLTNPQDVEAAMSDAQVWEEGGRIGTLRGIPIAAMDYLSAGLAGRVFKVSKLAAAPVKIGVHTGERMIFDPLAEATGELMAQVNAGQKVDWKEIAAEAGGAIGGNSSNMAINLYRDSRNNTNIRFADNLTKIGFLSSENASDSRITNWANNMEKLGKIDADVNQRIQENVGLRRDARDVLSIGKVGRFLNKSSETVNRVMELLAARQELSSNTIRRELNRSKITAINDEITAISETRKLLPQEQSVDLSLIIGTTRRGTSQYIIDGKRLTKDEFNYRLGKMNPEKVDKLNSEGKIIIRQDTDAMAAVKKITERKGSRVNTPDEEVTAEVITPEVAAPEVTPQAIPAVTAEVVPTAPAPTGEVTFSKETLESFLSTREEDEKNGYVEKPYTDGTNKVNLTYENAQKALDLLNEKEKFESAIQKAADTAPEGISPIAAFIDNELVPFNEAQSQLETLNQQIDAIQKQATSEVPVQSETGVSEKVEGGKPKTEPQVTTQEVGQEEVTPQASGPTTTTTQEVKPLVIDEAPIANTEIDNDQELDRVFNIWNELDKTDNGNLKGAAKAKVTKAWNKLTQLSKAKGIQVQDVVSYKRAKMEPTAPATQVAPAVSPTVSPAVAPTTQTETKKAMTREEVRAKEKEITEENRKAKENKGENINVRDFNRTKKRGQNLKIGDVYVRRIFDTLVVYKVLSKLTKNTGQFYYMDVEVLHVGNHVNRKEVGPDGEVSESRLIVGRKTVDSFKNMMSGTGKFNFGEVTVLENFEQAPEAKTEVAPAPAPAVEVTPTVEVAPAPTTTTETTPTTTTKTTPTTATETAPAKTEKEIKAEEDLEEDMVQAQAEVVDANEKIAEIQEEIAIEKSNTRDKVAEIKDKIAKIKATVANKTTQKRLIQELKDELENFKEGQENQIGIYNEDLAEQRAALRKAEAKFKKLEAKKAEVAPAPAPAPKPKTKQAPAKKGFISMAEVRQRFPLAADFIELIHGKKANTTGVTGNVIQNLMIKAYETVPKSKKAAIEFLKTLIEIEKLSEELNQGGKKVTKDQFKKQLADSGDFSVKQLRILNALVDSLQTDVMPEYIITEEERKLLGKNSKNFFMNATNQIVSRDPDALIHEIGHFGFFKILTGPERVKFFEYMINSTYGKTGVSLKSRLAFTVSPVLGIGPQGQVYEASTNVADNFAEYFAEQFSQWYMNERMVPAEIDTMFEKIAKFYNRVVEKFKSGKYVDKNLSEYFNKLSARVEQKRSANKKGKKADAIEPELAASIQELEDNLDLDFEDEFGLDDELSPMNRNFDTPLVQMAKMYNMKESGFFQNNVSTSHVNRDFYQFGLESKRSVAGTYYLVDINTKKMVNPFKTKRGGGNNTSNMARKVSDINKKRTTARDNVKSKIGVAQALAPNLNRVFSVNPMIIPESVFDKYVALVDAFTGRKKVLSLPEITAATANVQDVLNALDAEVSQVEALAIQMDNYTNKVFDANGNLDFDATITNMKNDGTVTEAEYKLLKKHKKRIVPKVSKPKMTPAQEKIVKDQLIQDIKSLVIRISGLATRFERNAAGKFEKLLTDEMLENLSISRLSNIVKLIDNINNGYFPHYAQLTINRLQGIKEAINVSESIRKVDPLKVSKFISSIKAKLTNSEALLEMIRRSPLFYIDQAFGDFKSKTIYNAVFQPVASAYSSFKTSMDRINNRIDRAHDRVARSYKYNGNKILESSFRMMTYMIQLEFESNPASKQVNPAASYLTATINKRNSMYGEAETKMLQDILDKYGVVIGQDKNGKDIIGIDNQALYASFNKAEKAALQTIRDINDDMTETAQHTASVIRGQSINPLNNYVHLRVMTDMNPEDAATATIMSSAYNNSLRPSTKAKNLEERTEGAKAINFDVYASAQSGAKSTLLDFFMTDPVRTVRGTISEATRMLEAGPKMTKEQSAALDAVNNVFEEVLKNVLSNSFSTDSFGDLVTGEIVKQGYRAVLASTQKFSAELLSNLSYVAAHPQEFAAGLVYAKYIMSSAGPDIMMNVDSTATNRTYNGESLSGRLVDTSAMSQSSGVKSARAKGTVRNVSNMIYNLTLKKYKNSIEVMADALISTPDKVIMRPVWFGAFANEFKKQTGADVDFDMIAANDEMYMQDNAEAIAAARNAADEQSVLMGATNNPFMAVTKGTAKPDMKIAAKLYHNFNNYMTTFQVFEFTAARQGIYAAVGNGTMSKARGVSLLAACMLRMTTYTLLSGMFAGGVIGLIAGKKDDDDDEKTIGQKATQATISTVSGLLFGRDLGNASKTLINYAIEKGNEKYLDGLRKEDVDPRTGEMVVRPYDPYKDQIAYSVLPKEGSSTDYGDMLMSLTGSSSPMFKTAKLAYEKWREDPKKEPAAIERQKREIQQRIPLEILGNMGLVPLYKEVRKVVVDDIYESLKDEKKQEAINAKEAEREKKRLQGYDSRSDMERYNPKLYEETFGPSSPDYAEDEAKREAARLKSEAKRAEKDKKFGYDPNAIPTKDQMTRSELKRYFPQEYDRKYGKGSPTYAEDEAEKAVSKQERDLRRQQLDRYYNKSSNSGKGFKTTLNSGFNSDGSKKKGFNTTLKSGF